MEVPQIPTELKDTEDKTLAEDIPVKYSDEDLSEDEKVTPETVAADTIPAKVSLGDRMKGYETQGRNSIDSSLPAVIRIDGHCFSKFTSGLRKPYEKWLHELMVLTTQSLMVEFQFCLGYTQSDEITLILIPSYDKSGKLNEYPFSGQVQKLVSLTAALATNAFTNGLHQNIADKTIDLSLYNEVTRDKLTKAKSYFDSRIFNVPTLEEAYSNLFWRSSKDCVRNSVSTVAQSYFSAKEMMGLKTAQKIEKLKTIKGIDWHNDFSSHFKYGTFLKKKKFEAVMPEEFKKFHKEEKAVKIFRTSYIGFSCDLVALKEKKEDFRKFIFAKNIEDKDIEEKKKIFNLQEIYDIPVK